MQIEETAVVILSGGMDSTTLVYKAKKEHKKVYAISFNYNQKHKKELLSARKTTDKLNNRKLKELYTC